MPTLYDNFSQVRQYIDQHSGGGGEVTIDENIIPKKSLTYTLGSSTYLYSTTYTNKQYSNYTYIGDINYLYNVPGGGLVVNRNGSNVCTFLGGGNIGISPTVNNGANLGNPDQRWKATYTNSLYLGGKKLKPAFVQYTYGTYTSFVSTYTYNSTDSPYLSGDVNLLKGNGLVLGGVNARISGEFTIANGQNSYACADNSVSLGNTAHSYGWSSLAVGRSVTTWNYGEVALGVGNFSSSSSYTLYGHNKATGLPSGAETIFSIGNGTNNSTYNTGVNALEIRGNSAIFIKGLGNYNGQNASDSNTYSLQTIINNIPSGDENIIPKENNTYTLGNSTYLYKEGYISNIYTTEYNRIYSSSNYNLYFQINGANRFYMDTTGFYGNTDGARNLGSSSNSFGSTYTQNLYLGGANIKTTINGMFSYDSTTGTLTITTIS